MGMTLVKATRRLVAVAHVIARVGVFESPHSAKVAPFD